MRQQGLATLVLAAAAALVGACSSADRPAAPEPDVLRVALLPDQSREVLEQTYGPLFAYVSERAGIPHRVVGTDSYADLVARFARGEIDLAYFGGVTFLQVAEAGHALPLVVREVDGRMKTYFLIRADHPARTLEDCRGLTLSFGSPLSTSGHFMPRYYLEQRGLVAERFFSQVRYTGRHDLTAVNVQEGVVDVGAANAQIVEAMYADGRLSEDTVRVLWETPPYTDYVWAVSSRMTSARARMLREVFLALDAEVPAHAPILERLKTKGFLPVDMADFSMLREIVASRPELQRDSG